MRAPRRLIVTIAAGALAVAGGSTLADAHDGGGKGGNGASITASATVRTTAASTTATRSCARPCSAARRPRTAGRRCSASPRAAWTGSSTVTSKAKVNRDGRVRVRIEGLVFAEGPTSARTRVPQLAATVYCGGTAVGTTKAVAFSPEGDAFIDETLATAPPSPCLVPAVLINPAPAGTAVTATYIAASGA